MKYEKSEKILFEDKIGTYFKFGHLWFSSEIFMLNVYQ